MRLRGLCRIASPGKFLACCAMLLMCTPAPGQDKLEYNRDVRPILADHCFACHGPDSAARKADLRLDQAEAAAEMGAIVPESPDDSELINRIDTDDEDLLMPPPSIKKPLSDAQKQILRQWIAEGAEYEPHWSLLPVSRPALPPVTNSSWPRQPLDTFVLARLEQLGLQPAEEADRRTLARRVSLDLTGLPPSPESLAEFLNDTSEEAYERYVDRLLESDAWGEHRARYWLDAARYADTHGIHFDNYREVWAYRDWVIRAFNRNLPFDQFTIEQLAGDLLPNPTLDQRIASGFNRCNITTNEGGVIPEEYLVLYTRDRTETVATVWMGTTAGCAVCHDHKFDSLSQRQFYEMAAFFNNTTQGAMDGNVKDTPPIVPVPLMQDRERRSQVSAELKETEQQLADRRQHAAADFDHWQTTAQVAQVIDKLPTTELVLHAPFTEGTGESTRIIIGGQHHDFPVASPHAWVGGPLESQAIIPEGTVVELPQAGDFERDQAFSSSAWVKLPANDGSAAICARMDEASDYRGWDLWIQQRRIGMHLIHRWPDNALKVVAKAQVPANEWTHVTVSYDGSGKAAGIQIYYNGQRQETNVEADRLSESTRTAVPFKIGQRNHSAMLTGSAIADLRVYSRHLSEQDAMSLAQAHALAHIVSKSVDSRTDEERAKLFEWWLTSSDTVHQELSQKLAALQRESSEIDQRGTIAHVMNEKAEPPTAYVLNRGEYDQRRDQVSADTPDALPPFGAELPRNRLGFAQWLLSDEHPLTARVTVNRFWQQVFGQGIVRTAGDFGVAGELPSHPELLDWLAVEFRESGWDVKRFFRMLVTSATYRQGAYATAEKLEADPENRWYSRGPRFRMDAEMVRDYALAVSGLLSDEIGGPSVKPYQPPGVWEAVAMIGSNTRDYRQDQGESLYRRSMYTFWKRSAPPASMEIFNAPSRENCTVTRERTNTPLQALVTLNDPQFIEAARVLATKILSEPHASDSERIDAIMIRLLARPATPQERPLIQDLLADLLSFYQQHSEDAAQLVSVGEAAVDQSLDASQLAAWTMLNNQLMNLDELLNK